VQRPEDVAEVRALLNGRTGLMVKIEKPAALKQLDEILDLADSIMVARGDLGVELPLEDVPAGRSGSFGPPGAPASRWWWRPRCSNR
jgi:pyruvate kinase